MSEFQAAYMAGVGDVLRTIGSFAVGLILGLLAYVILRSVFGPRDDDY